MLPIEIDRFFASHRVNAIQFSPATVSNEKSNNLEKLKRYIIRYINEKKTVFKCGNLSHIFRFCPIFAIFVLFYNFQYCAINMYHL